jgi:hypothetical protein
MTKLKNWHDMFALEFVFVTLYNDEAVPEDLPQEVAYWTGFLEVV